MHDCRYIIAEATEPFEQGVRPNDVMELTGGKVAPFDTRPQQIRQDHAITRPRQVADDMRPDETGASGDDNQIAASRALHHSHTRPFGVNFLATNY
jgi:hypothetical protein